VYGSAWGNERLLIDYEGGSEISVYFDELEGELSKSELSESE
jgi:hypothetical protein